MLQQQQFIREDIIISGHSAQDDKDKIHQWLSVLLDLSWVAAN